MGSTQVFLGSWPVVSYCARTIDIGAYIRVTYTTPLINEDRSRWCVSTAITTSDILWTTCSSATGVHSCMDGEGYEGPKNAGGTVQSYHTAAGLTQPANQAVYTWHWKGRGRHEFLVTIVKDLCATM